MLSGISHKLALMSSSHLRYHEWLCHSSATDHVIGSRSFPNRQAYPDSWRTSMAYLLMGTQDCHSGIQCQPTPKAAQSYRTCCHALPQTNTSALGLLSGSSPRTGELDSQSTSRQGSPNRICPSISNSRSRRAWCRHDSNRDRWIERLDSLASRKPVCGLDPGNSQEVMHRLLSFALRWCGSGWAINHRGTECRWAQGSSALDLRLRILHVLPQSRTLSHLFLMQLHHP